jgi:hypothetical protein
MELMERMKDARDETRLRISDGRPDRADRVRERLRSENDVLRARDLSRGEDLPLDTQRRRR